MDIKWAYLRKGWQTCKKAQEALDAKKIVIEKITEARKEKYDAESAWEVVRTAKKIITAKGKKVQSWNPQEDDKASILKQLMGPSGNLRAPTLHFKDMFIIGFNSELYDKGIHKK